MSRLVLLWIIALLVSAGALAIAGREYRAARSQAEMELKRLGAVIPQAQEIAVLRAAVQSGPVRQLADAAIAPRISSVLASCGLPAASLANVSPDVQTTGDAQQRTTRQRATITLAPITLREVGRFLDAWRSAEPDWTITSLDLAPQPRGSAAPGGDLPLRAIIVIETIVVHSAQVSQGQASASPPVSFVQVAPETSAASSPTRRGQRQQPGAKP
jgi:hypothetical protein